MMFNSSSVNVTHSTTLNQILIAMSMTTAKMIRYIVDLKYKECQLFMAIPFEWTSRIYTQIKIKSKYKYNKIQ